MTANFCRGHRGPGISSSYESNGPAFAHQSHADVNRRIAFGADCLHRLVIHGDDFAGVDNFNGEPGRGRIAGQLGPQLIFVPDKEDVNAVVPGRLNCTFNLRLRRPVGTHRVQRYDAWHGGLG
jgi:hypothetical protein